jgi:hypothetical protein
MQKCSLLFFLQIYYLAEIDQLLTMTTYSAKIKVRHFSFSKVKLFYYFNLL